MACIALGTDALVRTFSSSKGNEAFADLLKKMQGDDKKDEKQGEFEEDEKRHILRENDGDKKRKCQPERPAPKSKQRSIQVKAVVLKVKVQKPLMKARKRKTKTGKDHPLKCLNLIRECQSLRRLLPSRFASFKDSFMINVKEAFAELKGDHKRPGLRARYNKQTRTGERRI